MASHDEEEFIRECLESVSEWATEIVVVDGASRDATPEIAQAYADKVVRTTNQLMFNVNKNIAIDAAGCEWTLVLDPDERVSPELARELQRVANGAGSGFDGYWMARRNFELGVWITTMGAWPDRQLRFFRTGRARFPCEHMHEMVRVEGAVGQLESPLIHVPRQSLFEYVHKRNLNSEHRARYLYEHGVPFRARNLVLRPLATFVKDYVLRRGFRQGVPGFVIAVTGAFRAFLQDAKLWQKWSERESLEHTQARG
jgi:glycosyltransferase involved in cell wall biosynthesis